MMMENINNNNINDNLSSSYFPVSFFDGERELDIGTVKITPSTTFKSLQSTLREILNISPHQLTIYFERQNNFQHNYNHHRRRHPVTSKFDFGSILSESNTSFFWVVQKRSRRSRRRKPKNFPMENFALLRRNNTNEEFEYLEYVNRVKMQIQRERERYLMSMDLNSNVYDDLSCFFDGGFGVGGHYGNYSDDGASSSGGGSSIDYNYNRVIGFCEVCYNHAIKGETTPFHCCKNDAVTQIFRSPAGPIGPPKKNSILG